MKTASTVWLLLPLTAAACSLSTSDFTFDADTAAGGAAGSAGASAGSGGTGNASGSSGTGGSTGGTGGAGAAGKGGTGGGGAGGGGTGGTGGAGAAGSAGKGGGGTAGASGAGAGGTSGSSGSGGTAGVSGGGTGGTAGASGKGGSAGASGTAGSAGSGPCKDGDTQCSGVDIQTCSGGKFAKTSTCPTDTVCGMQNGKAVCSSCVPDQGKCAGTTLLRCASDGSGFELLETCMGTTPICDEKGNAGKGECDTCAPDSFQCIGPTLFKCNATGQGLVLSKDCGSAALCNASAGTCSTQTCTAGQRTCTNDTPMLCDTAQNKFVADGAACGPGLCNPASNVCFACAAGAFQCTGDTLEQCAADGSKWNTQVQCPAGKCDAGMKTCTQCTNGSVTCSANNLIACQNGSFTPGQLVKTCAANEICDAVGQQCDTCQPGAFRCNGASLMVCNADGQGEALSKTCSAASLCDAAAGNCKACTPGTFQCVGAGLQRCADDGSAWVDKETCASAALCDAPTQTCKPPVCSAGQTGCAPGPKFGTCKADLTGMDFVQCKSDEACTLSDGCTSPVGGPGSLAVGDAHTCAIFGKSGTVFCWGLNGSGQLGTDLGTILGPGPTKTSATDPTPFHDAVAVAAGASHTCALTSAGEVWCWGDNSAGQLGKGDVGGSSSYPTPIALAGETIVLLAAGGQHTCAVTKSGTTYCWGRNDKGQVGNGAQMDTGTPNKVSGLSTPSELTLAFKHTCAVVPVGTINELWCWGDNTFGELGIGATGAPKLVPTKIAGFTASHIVAAGQGANTTAHTCAHSGDKVFCWGNDAQGQLGDGSPTATPTTGPSSNVVGLTGVVAMDGNYGYSCASTAMSTACWGNCSNAFVCGGPTGAQATPLSITGGNGAPLALNVLGIGQHFGCGVSTGGILCWGLSNVSQLGSPGGDSTTARLIKLPLPARPRPCARTTSPSRSLSCSPPARPPPSSRTHSPSPPSRSPTRRRSTSRPASTSSTTRTAPGTRRRIASSRRRTRSAPRGRSSATCR